MIIDRRRNTPETFATGGEIEKDYFISIYALKQIKIGWWCVYIIWLGLTWLTKGMAEGKNFVY